MVIAEPSTICHMYFLCVFRQIIIIIVIYSISLIDTWHNNREPTFAMCYFPICVELNSHNIFKDLTTTNNGVPHIIFSFF
jgi:hypothetical protein